MDYRGKRMSKINLNFDQSDLAKAQRLIDECQYHIQKARSLADELASLNLEFKQTDEKQPVNIELDGEVISSIDLQQSHH